MDAFTASHDVPFEGDVDLEAVLASLPDSVTVRGMFLARYWKAIGAPWASVASRLKAPPTDGKYGALERYPIHDYQMLLEIAARERPGAHGSREAYRLLGRGEIAVFSESTLGRVGRAMLSDPAVALCKYPDALEFVAKGIGGYASSRGRSATITFPRFVGAWESTVGTLEQVVLEFDLVPSVKVTIDPPKISFAVTW